MAYIFQYITQYGNIIISITTGIVGIFVSYLSARLYTLKISTYRSSRVYDLFVHADEGMPNEHALYFALSSLLGRFCSINEIRFAFKRGNPVIVLGILYELRGLVELNEYSEPLSIRRSRDSYYYKNMSNILFVVTVITYLPVMLSCIFIGRKDFILSIIIILSYLLLSFVIFTYAVRLHLAFRIIECDRFFPELKTLSSGLVVDS